MKFLITGTAGFIGFHLALSLLDRGEEVVGLDSINNYYDVNLKYTRLELTGISKEEITYGNLVQSKKYPNYRFVQMKLEDRENIQVLFEKERFDKVCNLAAQAGVRYSIDHPFVYIDSNIVGFANILEASRQIKVKHLVYASSSSVYGMNETLPFSTSDNVDHPLSLYAASKKSNELMAHSYSNLFALPTTGLRFFTAFGPWGRPDMALFIFTKALFEDRPIEVYNHGEMQRDFTYIDDIVNGIVLVLDNVPQSDPNWDAKKPNPSSSKVPYKIYNIGNSKPIKLSEYINEIERLVGKKFQRKLLPMQPGDVLSTWADIDDLVENVNYEPKTEVKDGIKKFVDWYNDFYLKKENNNFA